MLRKLVVVVMLLFPAVAQAQVISVTSGEHVDFTRLVLALPAPDEWRLSRTETGYEVSLQNTQTRYDLENAFDLIPKDRLNGLFADPVTGRLHLTINCACHAIPFQLDGRTIVIDIRDGTAPETSLFESGLTGQKFPPLQGRSDQKLRPRPRPAPADDGMAYDWLDVAPEPPAVETAPAMSFPTIATDDIREQLVAQLAEGAARSVVDLALPPEMTADQQPLPLEQIPQVRVNSSIGLSAGTMRQDGAELMADGAMCATDEQLDVIQWGDMESDADQLTGLHSGLVGEFDQPQEDVLLAAVKRYLFLGFGAEARALITAFGQDIEDADMLIDMSYLLDGDLRRVQHSFLGMAGCDTAAAMWAFLSMDAPSDSGVNLNAVKRTFSALPAHLRQHFGPMIVEKLLAVGKSDDAMEISSAMGRTTTGDDRPTTLVDAKVQLESGNADLAVDLAEEILTDPGQLRAEALVQLVHAQIAAQTPVDAQTADSLAAMIAEFDGHAFQPDIIRAHLLALAGSGQFKAAFAATEHDEHSDPRIWNLLALHGTDDDILEFALTPQGDTVPVAAAELIAKRLSELGFPENAEAWGNELAALLPKPMISDGQSEPTVATDESENPLSSDLTQPDPPDTAQDQTETTVAAQPRSPSPSDIARWEQNWATVARLDEGPWGQLANQLSEQDGNTAEASLAAANDALAGSEATRSLVQQILQTGKESAPSP